MNLNDILWAAAGLIGLAVTVEEFVSYAVPEPLDSITELPIDASIVALGLTGWFLA